MKETECWKDAVHADGDWREFMEFEIENFYYSFDLRRFHKLRDDRESF